MNRVAIAFLSFTLLSIELYAAGTASVQIVDAKWPIAASRVLLKPDSPMPNYIDVRDVSAMSCDSKTNEPIGDVELKLKSNKKRVPLLVPLNQNLVLKVAVAQSFIPGGETVYQAAYGLAQIGCTRVIAINAKQDAVYNIEMLFKGKRCELKVSDNAFPSEPVKYTEYSDMACFNGQLRFY